MWKLDEIMMQYEQICMAIGQHKSQRWHKRNSGFINQNYCVLANRMKCSYWLSANGTVEQPMEQSSGFSTKP